MPREPQPPQSRRSSNRLLATLSPEALDRLRPEVVVTRCGEVLQEGHVTPSHVLFPDLGTMVSVVRTDESGGTVEVAVVGGDGATPLQSALASLPTRSEAIAQVPGPMTRVRTEAVRQAFASEEAFRNAVLLYSSIYVDHVSQNAVCNRLHPLEGRLSKWLLVSRRFVGSDTLELTHDFLSHMLGVRRAGVTVAINELAKDGLIGHARGAITITDPEGLERRACECEQVVREGWERLMKLEP
ncbi:MAG TPA: Crp/Fnr family transcriptional regulator [Thermoanaerobaculia bacterium]|jgi:CRP-like cAMP-binding protein